MKLPIDQIICGDCLEVMKDWPDGCVDLVLTDPPYGINYQSNMRKEKLPKIVNDDKPFVKWIVNSYCLLVDSGRLLCFERWDVEHIFKRKIEKAGFIIKSQIIWDKLTIGMGDLSGGFAPQHENAFYATKGRYEFKGRRPKTILRHSRVAEKCLRHPNEKPVSLMVEIIEALTLPNDLILDPFVGTGSTCIAAKRLGRKYIGIDISEKYCEIARKRLKGVRPILFKKPKKKRTSESFGLIKEK